MSTRRKAILKDLYSFHTFNHLNTDITVRTVETAVDQGARLEVEESQFKDPREDYTALLLNGERIGYWPGY